MNNLKLNSNFKVIKFFQSQKSENSKISVKNSNLKVDNSNFNRLGISNFKVGLTGYPQRGTNALPYNFL